MSDVTIEAARDLVSEHERLAYEMPIEDIVVADAALFQQGVWMPYFQRLRREDPVRRRGERRGVGACGDARSF